MLGSAQAFPVNGPFIFVTRETTDAKIVQM